MVPCVSEQFNAPVDSGKIHIKRIDVTRLKDQGIEDFRDDKKVHSIIL